MFNLRSLISSHLSFRTNCRSSIAAPCRVAGIILAFALLMPLPHNPLTLPAAYAHHGGGGAGSGGSGGGAGSGGSGGGKGGDGVRSAKPGVIREVPDDGYGKAGRGSASLKP